MRPFRPGWIPTLVVLALLPGLIALGCWQLRRADEKRALLDTYTERQIEAPAAAAQLRQLPDPAFYPVHLYGSFDAEHSLLLDNQMRDGKPGVELLQPFHDQASGQWLLVNRGWLPWPDRRVPVRFDTPISRWRWKPWCMSRPARRSSSTPTRPKAAGRICSPPSTRLRCGNNWDGKVSPMNCACNRAQLVIGWTGR